MPDHNHQSLHDQFVTLIDMTLHAQNQLYTSFSSWDLKVLKASLGVPEHAWPHLCKITSSICSFNRYVPACKIYTLYLQYFFEILKLRNPAIWLPESNFAFNSRTRFFPDMRFQQNHKGHCGAWFKSKKSTQQTLFCFAKCKKPYFCGVFGYYPQNEIFSQKSGSVSFWLLRHPNFLSSFRKVLWAVLDKTCLPTDILTVVNSSVARGVEYDNFRGKLGPI